MNEPAVIIVMLATGILLGFFFFFGLYWTVRRAIAASHPALWLLLGSLVRSTVVITGFYFAAGGAWRRILICLLGFIIARIIVLRLLRPKPEADHAP